jgi:hypothetical protein
MPLRGEKRDKKRGGPNARAANRLGGGKFFSASGGQTTGGTGTSASGGFRPFGNGAAMARMRKKRSLADGLARGKNRTEAEIPERLRTKAPDPYSEQIRL